MTLSEEYYRIQELTSNCKDIGKGLSLLTHKAVSLFLAQDPLMSHGLHVCAYAKHGNRDMSCVWGRCLIFGTHILDSKDDK